MNKNKFCSFFVSDYHLLTILLPYINEEMSNSKDVELIIEEDMIESVRKYLKRNEIFNVSKIIKLGWKKVKKENIENRGNSETVIVVGKEKFVDAVNEILDKKEVVNEIVNCYNIENVVNLNEIVMKHDYILKTVGVSDISKSSHNEQKRKTIKTQI